MQGGGLSSLSRFRVSAFPRPIARAAPKICDEGLDNRQALLFFFRSVAPTAHPALRPGQYFRRMEWKMRVWEGRTVHVVCNRFVQI